MPIHIESLLACVLGMGGGAYWFVKGFLELKSSRNIQNIPTSRIMTGALGTDVEIKGKILSPSDPLSVAPISGKPCAFYSIEIQKRVRSKNHSYWKKIDQFYSSEAFSVEDGSGAIARVFVAGADIQRRGRVHDFEARSHDFSSLPERLNFALQQNEIHLRTFKLKNTSWLFSQNYKFVEWSFQPQESVYVLGFAESAIRLPKKNKLKIEQFLQAKKMIEEDPRLQTRFDRDRDGILNAGELEKGAEIVGVALNTEPVQVPEEQSLYPVKMIFRKRKRSTFLISNIKEHDLVKKLSLKATLKVWGGPVLVIASASYLIFMLNLKL